MTHPFAALLEGVSVPQWHGPASVYLLLDGPVPQPVIGPRPGRPRGSCSKPKPQRWVPWTLMTPKVEAEIAAGLWDFSHVWDFPAKESA